MFIRLKKWVQSTHRIHAVRFSSGGHDAHAVLRWTAVRYRECLPHCCYQEILSSQQIFHDDSRTNVGILTNDKFFRPEWDQHSPRPWILRSQKALQTGHYVSLRSHVDFGWASWTNTNFSSNYHNRFLALHTDTIVRLRCFFLFFSLSIYTTAKGSQGSRSKWVTVSIVRHRHTATTWRYIWHRLFSKLKSRCNWLLFNTLLVSKTRTEKFSMSRVFICQITEKL